MARRDASRPQLDFPQLTADLIAALRLTGTLGLLEFSDQVTPVFLIGSRGIDFSSIAPAFSSAGVFSGAVTNPAANTIVADSGPLAAGTYDIAGHIEVTGATAVFAAPSAIEHRNAANNATLATLLSLDYPTLNDSNTVTLPLIGYVIGLNERLRIRSYGNAVVGQISGVIFTNLRPTP